MCSWGVYALALLLAMFISALHADITFGCAVSLLVFRKWAKAVLGAGPADILGVIAAISGLFVAHIAEAAIWADFLWKSGRLASFSDGWYFAGVSHTTLGTVMSCSRNRGAASADLCDQRAAYLRMFDGLSLPGAANYLATPAKVLNAAGSST
jgi:hypothetical protein